MRENTFIAYSTHEAAARAVGALIDRGVEPLDISVYAKDMPTDWQESIKSQGAHGITTTTAEDAASGAAKGAGFGLGIGVLAAIAAITIPGFGIVLGGGALASAIGGAAAATAAGAIAGGAFGFLTDQGVDEDSSRFLSSQLDEGGIIVGVTSPSGIATTDDVKAILAKYHESHVPNDHPTQAVAAEGVDDDGPRMVVSPYVMRP